MLERFFKSHGMREEREAWENAWHLRRDRQRGTSCPKGEMSEANESTCGVTESRTLPCGRGGSGRSTLVVGKARSRELCEALDLREAGCLLRDESSALPMTVKLKHRRGWETHCRPEQRCTCSTLTNAALSNADHSFTMLVAASI